MVRALHVFIIVSKVINFWCFRWL